MFDSFPNSFSPIFSLGEQGRNPDIRRDNQ
jgi:hypothetical protein